MKNETNLKVVHRKENQSASSQEETYQQLLEVKEDLQAIISLLDQHIDLSPLNSQRRGDTGKTSIASY